MLLSGCGGGSSKEKIPSVINGFPSNYAPPSPNFLIPDEIDPNFEILKTNYTDPYWISSLELEDPNSSITPVLEENNRVFVLSFPNETPEYDLYEIREWKPATNSMTVAAREISEKINEVLNIQIIEQDTETLMNVISVGQSKQIDTSGYSYFPTPYHEIGMDIFISKSFSDPKFISDTLTNYSYEVLLHEFGHALGLKHPFEEQGNNTEILNSTEDKTLFTAMSYNDIAFTFNGNFRPLDWMTLTKYYGVNPSYNDSDDIYTFSEESAVFVIDGGGIDVIDSSQSSMNTTIDLRYGSHSHLGAKSSFITSKHQLTISHGSDIENVITGSGDDRIIGNELENFISSGDGDDTIFAGGGKDIIVPGNGSDEIDLSEAVLEKDTVVLQISVFDLHFKTIYGFDQGADGDVINIGNFYEEDLIYYPLVVAGNAPIANVGNGLLRICGENLNNSQDLQNAFNNNDSLGKISFIANMSTIVITSDNQDTGEDQNLFWVDANNSQLEVVHVARLHGNSLDIDEWHSDNFDVAFVA